MLPAVQLSSVQLNYVLRGQPALLCCAMLSCSCGHAAYLAHSHVQEPKDHSHLSTALVVSHVKS